MNVRTWLALLLMAAASCAQDKQDKPDLARLRKRMVAEQIVARDIRDARVIEAMRKVPRHLFVPARLRDAAYEDGPLPIGEGQTISQPFIVAFMTQALDLKPTDRVLEIGTGSGYQAAILAEIAKEVCTIELLAPLGERARQTLAGMGYTNVTVRIGDGYQGWPEKAPFDAIIVTCAPDEMPQALVEQLKDGGRMILPLGSPDTVQQLVRVTKQEGRIKTQEVMDVRFVPMVKPASPAPVLPHPGLTP